MSLLSDIHSISDIDLLRESVDLECKLALGQDGQGKLPKDFWPTYSAMANTDGGLILLGVQEKKGHFLARGIPNPEGFAKNWLTYWEIDRKSASTYSPIAIFMNYTSEKR